MQIRFGTDGWRAVMADEFTFAHVRLVTQAVVNYLQKQTEAAGRGVVIGYDNRFLSEEFAVVVAEVLVGNGVPALLAEGAVPTPVVAFAVRRYGTAGALMLTASHNPPEYNGIKFIPDYAGPAEPEITVHIEKELQEVTDKTVKAVPVERAGELFRWISPRADYLADLARIVDGRKIRGAVKRIVVDPLFGAGIGYLEEFLGTMGCEIVAIHAHRDPLFGGMLPDPGEEALVKLREEVRSRQADLGLALDGDADRFGIVSAEGIFLSPNQVLPMLLEHLVERRGWRGPVARTVATTHLMDAICGQYGLPLWETPVGFKYIGRKLRDGAILGGEESGGFSVKGHVPEKDGILAAALMVEVAAGGTQSLNELWKRINKRFGPLHGHRWDLRVAPENKPSIIAHLGGYAPAKIGGRPVVGRLTVDGVKLVLADGGWILVRPSGTEPLFRLYVEAPDGEDVDALRKEVSRELGLPLS